MDQKFIDFEKAVNQITEVKNQLVDIGVFEKKIPNTNEIAAELGYIWSHVERQQGHATRAMQSLFELADEFDINIYAVPYYLMYDIDARDLEGESDQELDRLTELNKLRLNNEQLLEWYQKLGFSVTGNMSGDNPVIIRRPNEPASKLNHTTIRFF